MKIISRLTGEEIQFKSDTLEKANLDKHDLHRAILNRENLSGASLIYTNLRGAEIREANLSKANLSDALLMVASLKSTNLKYANLSKASLNGADLSDANLYSANLSGADVWKVKFTGANLSNANMDCLRINEANLKGSFYNYYTIWPEGFNPEDYGAILKRDMGNMEKEFSDNPSESHDFVMKLNSNKLRELIEKDSKIALKIIVSFVDDITSRQWPFPYTDKISSKCLDFFNNTNSLEIRTILLYALLQVGVSHNRWYAMDKFIEMWNSVTNPIESAHMLTFLMTKKELMAQINNSMEPTHRRISAILKHNSQRMS